VRTRLQSALSALSPSAARLCLATGLASLPSGYLQITLPIYLNKIGINPRDIGGLFAIASVVSAVFIFVFGFLADRFGRKPLVLLSMLLPVLSFIIFLSTTNPLWMTLAAIVGGIGAQGLSGALARSGFNALLAEKSEEGNRTFVFSVSGAAWTIAQMIGALFSGTPEWLQARGFGVVPSYQPLFWLSMAATLIAALVVWPVREEHRAGAVRPGWSRVLPQRSLAPIVKFSLFQGFTGLGLGFIVELLPLWFNLKFGVGGDFLGPWYAASAALSILTLNVAPWLTRRLGTSKALMLTQGVAAPVMAAMVLAPTAVAAAALYFVRQFLLGKSWPIQQAFLQDVVVPEERGAGNSIAFGTWGLAMSVSPNIGGEWLNEGLLSLPLLAGASSYLLAVVLFYLTFRRTTGARMSVAGDPLPNDPGIAKRS
jgi:MFS family permease